MTNKKIKGRNVYTNLRAKVFYDCGERNICGAWLALLDMGVSRKKVLEIDDDFYDDTVVNFRKDSDDGIIDTYIERFMADVKLSDEDIKPVLFKRAKTIMTAFPTDSSYSMAMSALRTDFVMLLWQIHVSLGYGRTRLKRVVDFIAAYDGDEKAEAWEKLLIRYPDPDALPDTASMIQLQKARQKRKQLSEAEIKQVTGQMMQYR